MEIEDGFSFWTCDNCEWTGDYEDLFPKFGDDNNIIEVCPECKSGDIREVMIYPDDEE